MAKDHCKDGFEKEHLAQQVFSEARQQCTDLNWSTFKEIITKMCPKSAAGLFYSRPCVRKLMYIEYRDFYVAISSPHAFFKADQIYRSLTFNGTTYTIEGYQKDEKPIGCAYFDRIT